jgi:hypothetical protein
MHIERKILMKRKMMARMIIMALSLAFLSTLTSAQTSAVPSKMMGPGLGGGGGAFVCRNGSGEVLNSELLDLWEAREILGWQVPYSEEPIETQLIRAILKIQAYDSGLYQLIQNETATLRTNARMLGNEVTIAPPGDAFPQYSKTGCPLEGAASRGWWRLARG